MTKRFFYPLIIFTTALIFSNFKTNAQNSLLLNLGGSACTDSISVPVFSFIKDPFGAAPFALTTCDLSKQLPSIYSIFIAYNPKNNKVYVADNSNPAGTRIWMLDMGLPKQIVCPSMIDSLPDYTYNFISNNFEFDNNGNLWSFSNYDDTLGVCNMDNFDVTTGNTISTRKIQFPADHLPSTILSGDITILPNGRMFAVLGFPSLLYEINNYNSLTENGTATFLDNIPKNCFGLAYLNGMLQLSGSDFLGNCYYYQYDIANNLLSALQNFQDGQKPVDNTSITPSLGVSKHLLNAQKINANTANLTYEIYVKNLGNVALNNINVSDNLAAIFGTQNISNIKVALSTNDSSANLQLNPSYNGNTDSNLLISNQNFTNQTAGNTGSSFSINLSFSVTNLDISRTYFNSAIARATLGNAGTAGFLNISDSSNNGSESAVDPNNDGNATEAGENVPTPFNIASLPVKFINISASFVGTTATAALINWSVASPTQNAAKFEIEYSSDGLNFAVIGVLNIVNQNQSAYQFLHNNVPAGNIFYRIKEIDKDGKYIYSNVVFLNDKNNQDTDINLYPNPANNSFIITSTSSNKMTQFILYNAQGKQLFTVSTFNNYQQINTTSFPDGTYILKVLSQNKMITKKVIIMHH